MVNDAREVLEVAINIVPEIKAYCSDVDVCFVELKADDDNGEDKEGPQLVRQSTRNGIRLIITLFTTVLARASPADPFELHPIHPVETWK